MSKGWTSSSRSLETARIVRSLSVDTGLSENTFQLNLSIPTVEDMEEVGALLSHLAHPPDCLMLDGGTCPR